MRKTFILSIIVLIIATGCKKTKYNSVPTLTYKGVNTTDLQPGQILQFKFTFSDKEGDFSDSAGFLTIKNSLSCTAGRSSFIQEYNIPTFPTTSNQSGEILFNFKYIDVAPQCAPRNDTSIFKFVLIDKAQHKSDTVTSDKIIIH